MGLKIGIAIPRLGQTRVHDPTGTEAKRSMQSKNLERLSVRSIVALMRLLNIGKANAEAF